MVGAIGGGALADRFHLKPVITIMFIVGSAALILLGINSPQFILYSLIAIAALPQLAHKSYSTLSLRSSIQPHFVQLAWAGHLELAVLARLSDQF